MSDSDILIDLDLDDRDFDSKLRDVLSGAKSNSQKIANTYKDSFKGVGSSFKVLVGGVIAGFSLRAIYRGLENVTELASIQEDAVAGLNASLRASGSYSLEASLGMQSYASDLQKVSTVGDETTLGVLSFAKALGATNKQAKSMTGAALDASAALGTDMRTIVQGLSQTLTGQVGILGRYIPQLRTFTAEQLKGGGAIEFIKGKYKGFAEALTYTYSGAKDQLSNMWGDALEKMGEYITKSPVVISAIKALTKGIEGLDFSGGQKGFDDFALGVVRGAVKIGGYFEDYIVFPLRNIFTIAGLLKDGFIFTFQGIWTFFTEFARGITSRIGKIKSFVGELFGKDEWVKAGLEDQRIAFEASDKSLESLGKRMASIKEAMFTLTEREGTKFSETVGAEFEAILQKAVTLKDGMTSLAGGVKTNGGGTEDEKKKESPEEIATRTGSSIAVMADGSMQKIAELGSFTKVVGTSMSEVFKGFTRASKTQVFDFGKTGSAIFSKFASGVGNAFTKMGQSLAQGKNGFKSFLNAMKSVVADIAGMVGDLFIKEGIGWLWTNPLIGGGLIAAGAGLKIFSGALGGSGNTSSASSGATSPKTVSGGGIANDFVDTTGEVNPVTEEVELRTVGTTVHVSVEGNIFDLEQTGQAIVESVNRAFETTGVQISGGAVA